MEVITPICSIIIRTLNEARYLGDLLQAISQQSLPAPCREVILVDSGSTDSTLEIAGRHGVRIVQIPREQFSFGRSLNLGCDVAKGEHLVFISGHCVPANSDWLWELLLPFRDEAVGVTYGRQLGGPETRFSEHSILEKYFPEEATEALAPFFCNNANAAFRRELWRQWRFDETLTGLEDMHLSKILVEHGARCVYAPKAAVYHYHHERWRQVLRRYEREALALQRVMPEIHVQWHDAFRYFAAGVLGDFSKAMGQKSLFRVAPEILKFRFCQYLGAWRGNRIHRALSKREKEKYFYPN